MKNLRKIIALFLFIFFTGIFVTVKTVQKTLRKSELPQKTVDAKKDSINLYKNKKSTV
ncbi:hypothetical protein IU405_06840 [Polaribacter sp. BAL334]|jgi:hypothetical protein|uniref:hypothetical protein n=1 Tax=Polaribacter sp. BAL334 TaxID=1708178 RepID=UPI0018D2454A|nr:hypothetical protein [Polaribacter sp. BAL334]MBG7611961.1 hypothetical protein [Polaribacter sp. BAL334]